MLDRARRRRAAVFPARPRPPARLHPPVRGGLCPGDPAAAVPQLPGERERHRRRLRGVLGGVLPASHHRHALHAGIRGPAARDRGARREGRQRRRAAAVSRSGRAALVRVRADDGAAGDRRPGADQLSLHRPLPRRGTHLPGRHPLHPDGGAAARRRHARARPEPVHVPGERAQAGADGPAGLGRAEAMGAHRRARRMDLRGGDLPVHPAAPRCTPLRDRHSRRASARALAAGRGGGDRGRPRRAGPAFCGRSAPGPALQHGSRLLPRVPRCAARHGSASAGAQLDSWFRRQPRCASRTSTMAIRAG